MHHANVWMTKHLGLIVLCCMFIVLIRYKIITNTKISIVFKNELKQLKVTHISQVYAMQSWYFDDHVSIRKPMEGLIYWTWLAQCKVLFSANLILWYLPRAQKSRVYFMTWGLWKVVCKLWNLYAIKNTLVWIYFTTQDACKVLYFADLILIYHSK